MNKIATNKMAGIAILTALYCVLSAMMKIPFIGAISLDLGYVAFAVDSVVMIAGVFISQRLSKIKEANK